MFGQGQMFGHGQIILFGQGQIIYYFLCAYMTIIIAIDKAHCFCDDSCTPDPLIMGLIQMYHYVMQIQTQKQFKTSYICPLLKQPTAHFDNCAAFVEVYGL